MSRVILAAGRRFGRFAGLLFVVPSLLIFAVWLSLLDSHTGWFFASAVVAVPLAMMAVAFLVGMLLAGFRRTRETGVSREQAPGLWQAWEKVAGSHRAAKTTILVEDDVNAGVRIERPFFGLIGQRIFLYVGLPLLVALDHEALEAILAHEDAHVLNKDTNGGLRLAEFEKTLQFVFLYADPETTVSGKLLYTLLGWLSESFDKENVRLSRAAEIAADRHAAKAGDGPQAARALCLIAAAAQLAKEEVYLPLEKELLGAMSPPHPPLGRLLEKLPRLKNRETLNLYMRKEREEPDDPNADHPPFAERLRALGYESLPPIEPVTESVLHSVLGGRLEQELVARFNNEWTNTVSDRLQ